MTVGLNVIDDQTLPVYNCPGRGPGSAMGTVPLGSFQRLAPFNVLALTPSEMKNIMWEEADRTVGQGNPNGRDAPVRQGFHAGPRIRQLRKQKGMSLQELALASGVSVGMLSNVERNLSNPSARVLTGIRHALGVPLEFFFDGSPPGRSTGERAAPSFLRRAGMRPTLDLGNLRKELLTSGSGGGLQIMIIEIDPGGTSGGAPLSYPAEKGGLVLEGSLSLRVGDEEGVLQEGDSFLFNSVLPHSFHNPGDCNARVLWIIGAMSFDRHL